MCRGYVASQSRCSHIAVQSGPLGDDDGCFPSGSALVLLRARAMDLDLAFRTSGREPLV